MLAGGPKNYSEATGKGGGKGGEGEVKGRKEGRGGDSILFI